VPIRAGDTFLVHWSDLKQPSLADAFNALVEAKVVGILEAGISPVFH
jgi:hypothetical protein